MKKKKKIEIYFKTKPIQVGIVCIALKILEVEIKDENGKPQLRNKI